MAQGKLWVFEQLGGFQKTLTLSGEAAPHGRARKGAVVRTPIKARTERTYYGGSSEPTRHVFGVKYDDWELKGRFRDRDLGSGGALAKRAEVEAFVADLQQVQVSWGDIIVFTGFIDEFDPGIEAESEIEWVMRLSIDRNDGTAPPVVRHVKAPQDATAAIQKALSAVTTSIHTAGLPRDLFDIIDNLLNVFTGTVSALTSVASQVRNFKEATFAEINRVFSAVEAVRAAGLSLRESFISSPSDVVAIRGRADDLGQLLRSQATAEEQMRAALAECAEIERSADRARVGRIKTTYTAATGDTWESISRRFYGDVDRANDLREANSAGPGVQPFPGFQYLIPK